MIIKNVTKATIVAKNCKKASTLMEMIFGLLWLNNPPELLFQTRFGLHTLLLKKPIDVIVLDDQFKVVAIKDKLKPNQFFFWNLKYQWVLELPADTIKRSKTMINDQLNFDPELQN